MFTVWWSDTDYSEYWDDFETEGAALNHIGKLHQDVQFRLFKELKVASSTKWEVVKDE